MKDFEGVVDTAEAEPERQAFACQCLWIEDVWVAGAEREDI